MPPFLCAAAKRASSGATEAQPAAERTDSGGLDISSGSCSS